MLTHMLHSTKNDRLSHGVAHVPKQFSRRAILLMLSCCVLCCVFMMWLLGLQRGCGAIGVGLETGI
jgi:hypothetical protein